MRVGGPGWRDWHAQAQRRHRRRSLMGIGAEHERARIEGMLMGLAMRDALESYEYEHSLHARLVSGQRSARMSCADYCRIAACRSYRGWLPAIRAVSGRARESVG